MVDDVVVAELVAVLALRAAQLREQVVAAVASLGRQVRAEEVLEERPGLEAPWPTGRRASACG